MSRLDTMARQAHSGADYARRYVEHLTEVLARLDCQAVGRVIDLFLEARAHGRTIFLLGNGGARPRPPILRMILASVRLQRVARRSVH